MKFVTAVAALVSICFGADLTKVENTLAPVTEKIYFDITIQGKPEGRIVLGMFGETTPKTVKNFVELSDGTNPISSTSGKPMTYKGSPFHRIIDNFMAQGGDITTGNGHGGDSIYGENFADENFDVHFTKPYLLAMANRGPNTNSSQFFITYAETAWLNGKHVVFGEVIEGKEVVDKMAVNKSNVLIADCGKL